MASGALFGNTSRNSQTKNLVEFKAGKMSMKGKTVIPDKRKGLLYLYQSDEQLMHLCWKERTKGTAEDDLIIFPDDIEFKKVTQCTTGRVYLIKFKTNSKKMFFWMQEPKSENDETLWTKLNDLLNNPSSSTSASSSSNRISNNNILSSDLAATLSDNGDIHNLLSGMDPQQVIRLITGMNPGILGSSPSRLSSLTTLRPEASKSSTSSTNTTTSSTSSNTMASSNSSSISTSTSTSSSSSSSTSSSTSSKSTSANPSNSIASSSTDGGISNKVQLSDLQLLDLFKDSEQSMETEEYDVVRELSADLVIPIMAKAEVQEKLKPFLPPGVTNNQTYQELLDTVHSPQFKQTLLSFYKALASRSLGPVLKQFDLGDEVTKAAEKGDLIGFASALQKKYKKEKE